MNVGVIVTTYDRIDDARINFELIAGDWKSSGLFGAVHLVHTYNGDPACYERTLEDELVVIGNAGHFQGACELIDAGVNAMKQFDGVDYVVVLAADTWLMKPAYVADVLARMAAQDCHLAAAACGSTTRNELFDVGITTDFFVVDWPFALRYGMFPIDYAGFRARYEEWSLYDYNWPISVERLVLSRFSRAIQKSVADDSMLRSSIERHLLRLTEREPIHEGALDADKIAERRNEWAAMGLTTHHDIQAKRTFAIQSAATGGPRLARLKQSEDTTWYNKCDGNVS